MPGAVLSCTVDLVDGRCPEGSEQWVAQTTVPATIVMAWPSYDEMMEAHTVGFMFFFIPALTMALVAYFVREMRSVIE